ncbi:hypothetical protein [Bosea vaviloviae]|uniref:Uncharacterized protein n=1 Tax=Bosea vaviloviae TaxID=1526658 RepID=A0A1D7TYV8_9HYPH|nr:hypothetical protein [Bosea vaviloviae]AOO80307.1 hypothetical protein BHK69_07355 [Bosea vaviloviae]
MTRVAFPFLTLGTDAVLARPWMLMDGDREVAIGDAWLSDWDSARDVTLRRLISIDLDIAAAQLRMEINERTLVLVVRIGTGAGNVPRIIVTRSRYELARGDATLVLEERIAGHELSQRLLVETQILANRTSANAHPLSPLRASSKVWADRIDLRLEGEEPRFPMEAISFSQRFGGRPEAHAPWFLHWTPGNLHRDFGGSVRLFVNSDRPDLVERLLSGDRATLQVVLADVMIQIISTSLRQADFQQVAADGDPGSIIGRVLSWMTLAFPGQDAQTIRSAMELRPSTFHAAILAAADVAGEEPGA